VTNECPEWPEVEVPVESIRCRRIERWLPLAEHARCPYCFGREAAVASGVHARFCDFVPGRDPAHFGFPPDGVRAVRG
jgi:hypothetical protein